MTSTLMPSTAGNAGVTVRDHSLANGGKNGGGSTAISRAAMRWSQDKLGLSLGTTRTWDSRGLKQLWKLIALEATRRSVMVSDLDQTQENDQNSINIVSNCISTTKSPSSPSEYGEEKHLPKEKTSPLCYHQQAVLPDTSSISTGSSSSGWLQLSGHPQSISLSSLGVVRKKVAHGEDYEVLAYRQLSREPLGSSFVPHFYGTVQPSANTEEHYIELQDLLSGFRDPCVMDIKMGCRTFLESEVNNKTLRPDLYQKMMALDANAPTAEEHQLQAITKLRYMVFRETLSSSHSKGFRIEALRLRGQEPLQDLKTVKSDRQIQQTMSQFLARAQRSQLKSLLKRLKQMRQIIENSLFFRSHEVVGSSVFIVYDETRIGCWLIDFAKCRPLPIGQYLDHRTPWVPGNHEEGLLKGVDELIACLEQVYEHNFPSQKCLKF